MFQGLSALVLTLLVSVFATSSAFQQPEPELPANYMQLPIIRQASGYSCGAAAMSSILHYWGLIDSGERALYADLGTTPEEGTHPKRMLAYGESLGLKTRWKLHTTLADLREWLANGETVVVDFQAWREDKNTDWKDLWEDGHYAVAIALDDHYIYLMDPSTASGYTYIPLDEFQDRWRDYENENGQVVRYNGLAFSFKGENPLSEYPKKLIRLE
jgi:ABC-type bacteriocin/lantibiotic exporter with double-glycine peptidase domain